MSDSDISSCSSIRYYRVICRLLSRGALPDLLSLALDTDQGHATRALQLEHWTAVRLRHCLRLHRQPMITAQPGQSTPENNAGSSQAPSMLILFFHWLSLLGEKDIQAEREREGGGGGELGGPSRSECKSVNVSISQQATENGLRKKGEDVVKEQRQRKAMRCLYPCL